jgi:hypothetical protein
MGKHAKKQDWGILTTIGKNMKVFRTGSGIKILLQLRNTWIKVYLNFPTYMISRIT